MSTSLEQLEQEYLNSNEFLYGSDTPTPYQHMKDSIKSEHQTPFKEKVTEEFLELLKEASEENVQVISAKVLMEMLRKRVKEKHDRDLNIYNRSFQTFLSVSLDNGSTRGSRARSLYDYHYAHTARRHLNESDYLILNYSLSKWNKIYSPFIEEEQNNSSCKWLYRPLQCQTEAFLDLALKLLLEEDRDSIPCSTIRLYVGMTNKRFTELRTLESFQNFLLDRGLTIVKDGDKYEERAIFQHCFKLMSASEKIHAEFDTKYRKERRTRTNEQR